MKPTLVQLEGGEEGSEVTFEQAFGEFSELRGRGRERRRKRRQERRMRRLRDRQERMRLRQEMRDERRKRKLARKAMGDEEEEEGGGSSESGEGGEGGEGGSGEEGQSAESSDSEVDSQTGESDTESGFTGDYGFDGAIELSPDDAEWNEYFSSAEGYARINPKVKRLAKSIEQHKELIGRKKAQLRKYLRHPRGKQMDGRRKANIMRLKSQIVALSRRLAMLEKQLASYSKHEGDYSKHPQGRRGVARRKAEVRHAKLGARLQRKQMRRGIPVQAKLNPVFSKQKIDIPAKSSSFEGTGLIGLDEQNDIDAPETRKFDLLFSNADGDDAKKAKTKNLALGIGLGIAVGALAIYVMKKYGKR